QRLKPIAGKGEFGRADRTSTTQAIADQNPRRSVMIKLAARRGDKTVPQMRAERRQRRLDKGGEERFAAIVDAVDADKAARRSWRDRVQPEPLVGRRRQKYALDQRQRLGLLAGDRIVI